MNPSETAIEEAVENLKRSPGTFQRLVERYAQLTFPERFRDLLPQGRNAQDVAIKGWPDAYVQLSDGRIDAVEMTHSPAWEKHLSEDYEKAKTLGPNRLAGFVYVAWAPAPSIDKINEHRERFITLGVPADRIKFVFKQELVSAMARPRYSELWVSILDLRCDCLPFQPIRQAHLLFGRDDQVNVFAPTKREYEEGKVHRPQLSYEIGRQLNGQGWAFVRGLGAAGKTVLATQTALGPEYRNRAAYYCDLVTLNSNLPDAGVAAALETITTRSDDGVLFVVDNVHIQESFARALFDHWKSNPNGSKLLLLGRWVSRGPDVRGLAGPLDDLEPAASILQVRPDDLAGVYLRLALRHIGDSKTVESPSADVLQVWSKLFGGDLIAFSAAVANRIEMLLKGRWQLRAEDAVEYVRNNYLDRVNESERQNLLTVAVLSRLEFDAPGTAIERGLLQVSLRSGVVHRAEHGRDKHVRYHLVHPGLGELLLKAHDQPIDEADLFIKLALKSPFHGMQLSGRLLNLGRANESAKILKVLANSAPSLIDGLLLAGVGYVRLNTERMVRLSVCNESKVDECLASETSELEQAALRTPLDQVVSFLGYAERKLPAVHKHLSTALSKPEHLKSLTETALRSPPQNLASFLGYSERKLRAVHKHLSSSLSKPEHLQSLTEMALRSPLEHLARFLGYSERMLPAVHKHLSTSLSKPEHLKSLTEMALRSPLEHLASFLGYSERRLPAVHKHLSTSLSKPEHLKSLTETALSTKLDNLASFLRVFGAASELVNAIELHDWEQARRVAKSEQPDFIGTIDREFRRLGRPELSTAPAETLIADTKLVHWHNPAIGIFHLSHTLRLGHTIGEEAIQRFLDLVLTGTWLDNQYQIVLPGTIGAALLSIWSYHTDAVASRFSTNSLRERLTQLMQRLGTMSLDDECHALQLWGTSHLMRMDIVVKSVQWPSNDRCRDLLELVQPQQNTIELRTIQLWLGLRRMVMHRTDTLTIPADIGRQILTLWKDGAYFNERQASLNRWMIDWLERCEKANWQILPDETTPPK